MNDTNIEGESCRNCEALEKEIEKLKEKLSMPAPILKEIPSIVVFPDTDLHRALAKKLAVTARPGAIVPLSIDEMALLSEFIVWPNPRPTASF